ncbi:MAG TPA: hypothetical protein VFR34_13265, partial [Paracoccaceae bacterium]|nr:hypothetical protein [Paracoccaceae bacterium]
MSQTIVIPDGDTTPRVTPAPEVRFVVEAGSRTETHGAPAVTLSEDATELLNAGEIATAGAPAVRVLGDRVRIENDGGELGSVVRVTAENLVPESGGVVAPLWFGFHDGGVDSFDEGAPASPGIANLSQDGITRREGTIEGLIDVFLANGLDP